MLALGLALLSPAAVQGEDGLAPPVTGFRLQATNGFVLLATVWAPPAGDEGWIGVYLIHGRREAAVYAAPATVTPTTADADLGALGRISVTRAPTGRTETARLTCAANGKQRVEAERYEGTIEFHGEEGFADVSATGAPLLYPMPCGIPEGGSGAHSKSLPGARLDVEAERSDSYRLEFDAIQARPGARTAVSAEVEEHKGEIEIHRATSTWASSGALRYDRGLQGATVKPPAPFSGHGVFRADAPRAKRWTGNLTVDLPGRANVRVAGPGFLASLEHPRVSAAQRRR